MRWSWVRSPPGSPAFAPLRLAAFLGELRLGKPAGVRRLSRRSCGRTVDIRTPAKADYPLPSGLPRSSGSYGWASQLECEGCPAEAVGGLSTSGPQRRRTTRSPPACRVPRGATAGQASWSAKAVPPKLWEDCRHPDPSEGGLPAPLRLAAFLGELRLGKPAGVRRLSRRSCGRTLPSGPQRRRTTRSPPACRVPLPNVV